VGVAVLILYVQKTKGHGIIFILFLYYKLYSVSWIVCQGNCCTNTNKKGTSPPEEETLPILLQ